MRFKALLTALLCLSAPARAAEPAPVEVMIVGTYHMSNPGRDLHNMKADDVLAPKRQAELAAIAASLARFRPTKIAVEWDAPVVAERYPKYLAGTLEPSHNEVVQLGFRLAKAAGSVPVFGIDVEGEFPYEPVKAYAAAHGMTPSLDAHGADVDRAIAERERVLADKGIAATLRSMNDPARIKADQDFYRSMLRIGGGAEQPGADLLTAWYRRNFLICANLIQLSRPGDRIVVFYGAGHAFLLRQCVSETPGMILVEANAWLPR
ncbi:DUF5694 domain-containing protein [Sphingomonas changbaiensis]|nr:DUF5694 domain-containing protein [Sphingomonas changbaiensis]